MLMMGCVYLMRLLNSFYKSLSSAFLFFFLHFFSWKPYQSLKIKAFCLKKRFFFFLYYFNMWVEKQKKAIQIKKEAKSPNHSRLLKLHFFFKIMVIQKLNTLNSQFFKSICWSFKNISNGATWNVYGVMMMHRLHTQLWCKTT